MPFPILPALAMLFMAGSAGANAMAQNRVRDEREDTMEAERIRQRGFDQETTALNTQSQDRYKDFSGKQEGKSRELADFFTEQSANQPAPAGTMPISSSDIVTREIDKQSGAAQDAIGQQGAALANLRSFGDLLGDTSILQARDASKIGQIGGFKRGSAGVLPYELEEAAGAGDKLKTFADILSGLSSVTGSVGGGSGGTLASMFSGGGAPMRGSTQFAFANRMPGGLY